MASISLGRHTYAGMILAIIDSHICCSGERRPWFVFNSTAIINSFCGWANIKSGKPLDVAHLLSGTL